MNIAKDEMSVFSEFAGRFDLAGAQILEVGGCLPEALLVRHKIAGWVSMDPVAIIEDQAIGPITRISAGIKSVPFPDETFDYVFSSNAFEHVQNFENALREIRRVLKPGGKIFSHFGPIWSAPDGHHMEFKYKGRPYNFWETTLIPHWYHLIYNADEFFEVMASMVPADLAKKLTSFVYKSPYLNRLCFDDYIELFKRTGLKTCELVTENGIDYPENFHGFGVASQLTPSQVSDIVSRKYGRPLVNFTCRDLKVVLER